MLRNPRAPLMGTDPIQTPAATAQYQKPTFQSGSFIYEMHGSSGHVTTKFTCGRLLGRGGFAKCYEVFDGKETYALKAINRASLDKPKTLQKLHSEIAIHSRMKHRHIVNFIRTFKDRYYVYILLEKCDNGTLMDLLKARPLTVPETQYVMLQCLAGMQYMHDQNVIHRDLKPGNIMLDSELNVKIGDFGLAAELAFDGERKRTVCGTPNYIAPEIIDRKSHGHSFEVDTWSLGVILYTLLVGQPPFQMEDVESTYSRIRACRYDFPASVPENARDLIRRILQSTPTHRPTLLDIRTHAFFSSPVPPAVVPTTFAGFGLTLPSTATGASGGGSRRASAPVTGDEYGKAYGQPQREVLRPISANYNPPVLGGPLSPRQAGHVVQKLPPPPLIADGEGRRYGGRTRAAGEDGTGSAAVGAAAPTAPGRRPTVTTPAPRGEGGHALYLPHVDARAGRGMALAGSTPESPRGGPETAPREERGRRAGRRQGEADDEEDRRQLTQLHDHLHQTLCGQEGGEHAKGAAMEDRVGGTVTDSAALPTPEVWVTECADFSNKYGLCYRLSTGHTGAHYNDSTKMVWEPITGRVEYYARVRVEVPQPNGEAALYAKDQLEAFNMAEYPGALEKKITLIKYFKTYLGRARSSKDKIEVVPCTAFVPVSPPRLSDPHVADDFVYVKRWLRTPEALVFRLSNKTVQVCFSDRAEVILSSEWKVVTYTDPSGNRRTLPLSLVANESAEAAERLRYTKSILYKLIKDNCL